MVAASLRAGTTAITLGQAFGASCAATSSLNLDRRQKVPRATARYSQMDSETDAIARRARGTGYFALDGWVAARRRAFFWSVRRRVRPDSGCGRWSTGRN